MANPTCPTDCSAPLPIMSFDECAPSVLLSEVELILFAKATASPISDPESPTEWAARLSNDSTSPDAIRIMHITGDLPAATDAETTIRGRKAYVISRSYVLNADIEEANQLNHDAVRQLQCNASYRIWFVTAGGKLFGGSEGIIGTITANLILARGENEVQKYTLAIKWRSQFMPEMNDWPLSVDGTIIGQVFDTSVTGAAPTKEGVTVTLEPGVYYSTVSFNKLSPLSGTPASMNIKKGAALLIVLDYPLDYEGKAFKYTNENGATFIGTFANASNFSPEG